MNDCASSVKHYWVDACVNSSDWTRSWLDLPLPGSAIGKVIVGGHSVLSMFLFDTHVNRNCLQEHFAFEPRLTVTLVIRPGNTTWTVPTVNYRTLILLVRSLVTRVILSSRKGDLNGPI